MNCRAAVDAYSSALDGRLPLSGRRLLDEHLANCAECTVTTRELHELKAALQEIGPRPVPDDLTMSLRVVASREREQQSRRASLGATIEYWGDRARLWMQNLMKPLALPVVGGSVLSTALLLTLLMPMYGRHSTATYHAGDVPTTLTRPAALVSPTYSFGPIDADIVIDVWVDGEGRMIDYSIPSGQDFSMNTDLRRTIENALLCTKFQPATMFGQPASGKLRITLRQDQVEVRG